MIRLVAIQLAVTVVTVAGCATSGKKDEPAHRAEAKAVGFLVREVPAWSRDNGCFSCHNNGDAARALYAARRNGYRISERVLAGTTAWVSAPEKWDDNKGDPGFSDQRLADVQFAAALVAALPTIRTNASGALNAAARRVAAGQTDAGTWPIDAGNPIGSPATYGTTLATFMAWQTLTASPVEEARRTLQRAENALLAVRPDTVPNAATLLLFHRARGVSSSTGKVAVPLEFLRRAQTSDGGWGPYADSPAESFDTALALLALAGWRSVSGVSEMIVRGRAHLDATQWEDGSWSPTTRPSGGTSYAQQISTTGWAALALLATR